MPAAKPMKKEESPTPIHLDQKDLAILKLLQHNKTAGTKFIKAINEMNEVIECYNISGEFDFMLKVVEENMDSYYDFHVNRLSEIENIGNVQSTFVMGVVKQTHVMV